MRVFLTGGTGFIGQPLTAALLAHGWEVTALVRRPGSKQAARLQAMGAHCLPGDVTDRESMRAGMAGADVVIHNAAWYEIGISRAQQALMQAINVGGTEHVLGLALELQIPRVVYISSTTYYGDTGPEARDERFQRQSPIQIFYERTKVEAHEVAQAYQARGLPLITISPAHVIGPNDHSPYGYFLRLYLNGVMTPFAWAPEAVHSPVHVADVAEGIVLAVEKGRPGEQYVLSGDAITIRETMALWGTQPGGLKVRFYLPLWLAGLLNAPIGPLLRALGMPPFTSRETVTATSVSLNFNSAKAQRELGWHYQPTRESWLAIIAEERRILAERKGEGLLARLKPAE